MKVEVNVELLNIEYDALKCNHHALLGGIIALRDGFNKYGDANKDILSPRKPGNTSPPMAIAPEGLECWHRSTRPTLDEPGRAWGRGTEPLPQPARENVATARRCMWNPT